MSPEAGFARARAAARRRARSAGLGLPPDAALAPKRPRRARTRVVRAIQEGIAEREFELHFQPQIDIQQGRPCGAEALVRWRRNGELLLPGSFLADAEASSAIGPLTEHILTLALTQAGEWRRSGHPARLAVNLSAANLHDFTVARDLERLAAEHDVDPGSITLEVTETAVLDEPEKARAVLDAIADLGFGLSVDDFGTGYSSLLWLRLFPVSEVKIDRTFVANIATDGEAFVAGVVRLGHDLGMTVVAEGVEDEVTLEALQELGCDLAQGFHFARPLPAVALERWLARKPRARWAPYRRDLAVTPDERGLDEAREAIDATASELGFDAASIWDMKLAATEALTNAFEHGPPNEDGRIHLRVAKDREGMLLEIRGGGTRDRTPGASDPSRGRGIAIMTALMDGFELRRDARDSVIRLSKSPAPPPATG